MFLRSRVATSLTLACALLTLAGAANARSSLTATFLGGSGTEGWQYSGAEDIVLAGDGTAYVVGVTSSSDFPVTPGAYVCTSRGQEDFFVARFTEDLSELLAATVIGGEGNEIYPRIGLGPDGSVYVSGNTRSSDFPTTSGVFDETLNGLDDVFVVRFDAALTTLLASTYLGGNGDDNFPQLAMDEGGSVVLIGLTASTVTNTFPTTAGAYDRSANVGYTDIFVSTLNSDLTQLLASTFIGGRYNEQWPSVAVDAGGNIIISSASQSDDYPTTTGAYCEDYHGTATPSEYRHDVVVSKLNPDLTAVLASTYIGTEGFEGCGDLCLDYQGNIFVSGHTDGVAYPVTLGAYDESHNGVNEYFVTKLDNNLTSVLASTFFTPGDASFSFGTGMTCDGSGRLIMTGAAFDQNCPTTTSGYDRTFNGDNEDLFVRVMTPDLTDLIYGTLLGSPGDEGAAAVAVAPDGVVYLVSYTTSLDFPASPDAHDNSFNGGAKDAVVARLTTKLFTRITEGPLVNDSQYTAGVCMVDYDGDCLNDIYAVNTNDPGGAANALFRNTGDATFEKVTGMPIVQDIAMGYGASWADFEGDGDLDVAVANFRSQASVLYLNDGQGGFTATTNGPRSAGAVGSTSASWIDYDLDHDLDLFIANSTGPWSQSYPAYVNFLFRNDGGTLSRVTSDIIATHSRHTYGASWADFDNDGDPDLVNANNMGEPGDLFLNNGDGGFGLAPSTLLGTDVTNVGGCSWADYDNDGDLDLFVSSSSPGPSLLYRNDGGGSLTKVADHGLGTIDGRANAGIWADYDNDGDQDIFVWLADYQIVSNSHGYLFENHGDGTFGQLSNDIFHCDSCTAWSSVSGDVDRDGDMDLFLARTDPQWQGRVAYLNDILYLNNGNSNRWITVKPVGTVSNRSAVGVKVRCMATINGQPVWQLQELQTMTGLRAQPPLELHFGLGDAVVIDSLKLEWPSGITDVFADLAPNQLLTITEGSSDIDGDGVTALTDNCSSVANPSQADANADGIGDACCCVGTTGNVNYTGIVDLADLSALVSYLTGGGYVLPCPEEANVNAWGIVDLSDLSALVSYLTGSGYVLPSC